MTDTVYTKESSVPSHATELSVDQDKDEHDEKGHSKNTSPQAVVIRRAKLRNIFRAITASTTGTFDDVFENYHSVYSRNRVAVWFWIFESKGWVRFDNGWKVIREPTDDELDEVTKAYLQRHGNYDTPDTTCLDDIRKREKQARHEEPTRARKHESAPEKPQTEMSWPEIKKSYAEKRQADKAGKPGAPPQKNRRVDWDKILDGVRDILFDTPEPITATAIRRALGDDAPSLPGLIDQMGQDKRFQSNDEKRWSLAKEETAEEDPKKKKLPGLVDEQW